MGKKYLMDISRDGHYYFSRWVKTELDREEWDVSYANQMAGEGIFLSTWFSYNTELIENSIQDGINKGAAFMIVSVDEEIIYKGKPDYNSWLKAVIDFYEAKQREQKEEAKRFFLRPDFKDYVLKYLEAARVLVADENNMEEIIHQRDKYYGEEDEIRACIEGIKKVL